MDWLPLPVSVLLGPDMLRIPPAVRAAWLSLLAHCALNESGGVILGAKSWTKRDWDRLAGTTRRTIDALVSASLAAWSGENLVVSHYPTFTEERLRAKKAAGKLGGLAKSRGNAPSTASPGASNEEKGSEEKGSEEKLVLAKQTGLFGDDEAEAEGFDFDAVYALYPRKDGRKKGIAKLERAVTKPGDFEALMRAVKNYAASREGQDSKFTKHFSTWAGEWEDWVDKTPEPATPALDAEGARLMVNNVWAGYVNLADIEARRTAAGLSIPWSDHPLRRRMVLDASGRLVVPSESRVAS